MITLKQNRWMWYGGTCDLRLKRALLIASVSLGNFFSSHRFTIPTTTIASHRIQNMLAGTRSFQTCIWVSTDKHGLLYDGPSERLKVLVACFNDNLVRTKNVDGLSCCYKQYICWRAGFHTILRGDNHTNINSLSTGGKVCTHLSFAI